MTQAVTGGVRAVLVHINFRSLQFNEELDEFRLLAGSSGLKPVATITGQRDVPDARYFVGKGKVEDIKAAVAANDAGLVIFNHALSPAQERNVERECGCRVLDRVGLILDIFAQRARSYEGKLQVELAQLQHLLTRLVRGWSHLERQKGGIGLRGPGETQLETDRRLIGRRIRTINSRLEKVKHQRDQGRRLRRRTRTPLVSLVGYTNAGKSTLFNHLSGADVYAANKLFATLDPTLRQIEIPHGRRVVLSDTVGFIRHIPHDLVESFRATLEDVKAADLLLHVIDSNAAERDAQIQQVEEVIASIGAGEIPHIRVFNKIDLKPGSTPRSEWHPGAAPAAWISAATGAGMDELRTLMGRLLTPLPEQTALHLPASAGRLRARLFEHGAVLGEREDEQGGWVLQLEIDPVQLRRLMHEQEMEIDLSR